MPEQDLELIRAALPEHIALTRQEAGCLSFAVTQDADNPYRFNVREEFEDQASFALHQERVRTSPWGRVSVNVSRHYQVYDSAAAGSGRV